MPKSLLVPFHLQKLQEIDTHQQLTTNLSELTSVIERLPTGILLKIGNEQEQAGVSAIERILETGKDCVIF